MKKMFFIEYTVYEDGMEHSHVIGVFASRKEAYAYIEKWRDELKLVDLGLYGLYGLYREETATRFRILKIRT